MEYNQQLIETVARQQNNAGQQGKLKEDTHTKKNISKGGAKIEMCGHIITKGHAVR